MTYHNTSKYYCVNLLGHEDEDLTYQYDIVYRQSIDLLYVFIEKVCLRLMRISS